MPITNKLIAKLLLAVFVVPAAGYGGYCIYDHCYPTFHNQLIGQGWTFFPINEDVRIRESFDESHSNAIAKVAGDWRCSKQLFSSDFNPPSTDTSGKERGEDGKGFDTPTKPTISDFSENENTIGCLVANLGHASGNKRSGFIKWELALKSGNRGFVYTGFVSFNTVKGTDNLNTHKRAGMTSASLAFEISQDESKKEWKVGKGFLWGDMLISNPNSLGDGNDYIRVVLPNNEYEWEPQNASCKINECTSSNDWIYKKWVGFWEYKADGDKQPTDALFIGRSSQSSAKDWTKKEYQHDIWQTQDFDFEKSNQIMDKSTSWASSISEWYDDNDKKWKDAKAGQGDKGYLKEIYKPWARKKGTWIEAEGLCHQSNSRGMKEGDEEAKRLLKFCYQKINQ